MLIVDHHFYTQDEKAYLINQSESAGLLSAECTISDERDSFVLQLRLCDHAPLLSYFSGSHISPFGAIAIPVAFPKHSHNDTSRPFPGSGHLYISPYCYLALSDSTSVHRILATQTGHRNATMSAFNPRASQSGSG